jgi:capsular exopolysaccharide synthesis family protein
MIRILLADDQKSIREVLRVRLESEPDFEVVGTASDGYTALELAEILHPDILLLDMEMPGIDGVRVTQLICESLPDVKVLALSAHDDDNYVTQAIRAGAMGYLLKNTPAPELRDAIRFVNRGYSQLGPGVLSKVVSTGSFPPHAFELRPDIHSVTYSPRPSLSVSQTGSVNLLDNSSHALAAEIAEASDSAGWGVDFLAIMRRRWLPILATVCTTMAAVVINTFFLEEPTYISELWVQVSNQSSVPVASLPEEAAVDVEKDVSKGRTTEVQILQSSPLIADAIALLPEEDQQELSVEDLKKNLKVTQAEEDGLLSNVLIAEYTDINPKRTRAVLDAIAKAAINYNAERTRSRATSAIKFIEHNLPSTRQTLNQANAAVREFRKRYGMVNPENFAEDLTKTKLTLANDIRLSRIALNQAESKIKSQQNRLLSLGQNPSSAPLSAVLGQDEGYQALAKQLREIQVQLNLQQTNLGLEHPTIQSLREQQARILSLSQQRARNLLGDANTIATSMPAQSSISTAPNSSKNSSDNNSMLNNLSEQLLQTQTDFETQRNQLASLLQAQETVDKRFQQLPKLQETYGELQRQVTLHSTRLERLLQKLQELRIAAAQETSPWTILEPPALPKKPISPNIPRNLLFGVLFSGALGLAAALLLERLDPRVRSLREVKDLTGLPILGSIPNLKLQPQKQRAQDSSLIPSYNCIAFEEAFRSLAMQLQYFSSDFQVKMLAITSAEPGEGKSTITYELGLTLAKLGFKILLIDADMHCPTLHVHSELANRHGLSDVLSTNQNWQEIVQVGELANLSILNAGSRPTDSLALLRSEKMITVLKECRQDFDYVLIDTPPVTGLTDAQGVASIVDSTVLVVGLEQATKQSIYKALNLLKIDRNRIAGIVANFHKDQVFNQQSLPSLPETPITAK